MKKNTTFALMAALVSNLSSAGGKLYGYADQVMFYRTGGGSILGIFSFIYNGKLHAIAVANDGAGNFFQFIPKSVLINNFGVPSAYATGFVETADAGLTLLPQDSKYTTGVRIVSNISPSDAANAINTLSALEKGTKVFPTTDGYFVSVNGAVPPSSALPITTADGTVPDKKITTQSDGEGDKNPDGSKKTWIQKNWGYVVAGVAVVGIIVAIVVSKR
ncbi:hypothetical protein GCM10011514_16730 [Emticicia aquatilis]|uniref:Uncharacterized protein n=1 Tax=Emticicia aquatilis TaxID=1537369 RepID=A0A916YPK2_9BACT|nr:hypothetical protein [Emticicia aquatilis]GGD53270.1 hypothetical protein GCM10011514_16730 [Emticicia aquatilis]